MPEYTLEQVYQMIMTSTFEPWYNKTFTDYITGEVDHTKEQMLDELKVLL
jgi:hypothetical protein